MYRYGKGTAVNSKKAFEYFKKAANQGHAVAQYDLGHMYYIGIGTDKNLEKTIEYYEKAANQGNTEAQSILGWMYENGKGTAKNLKKAFEYYEKAANQGNRIAQNALGHMYKNGQGTAKNLEKALEYFQKAADQGDIHSRIEIKKLSESKSAIPSVIQISENSVAIQIQQPIQPIAVKRPFILDVSESSAFSSSKKQTIQIE
jgi:hypothetical protein